MKTIKTYKGIELKYCEEDGCIYFNFEKQDRKTKYIFEAKQIIDEPIWEDCNLKGYFVDGYVDKFIGLAKAKRKNIKTNEPDWYFQGQYDQEYKKPNYSKEIKVYPKNEENDDVYTQWKNQKVIYIQELHKLNNIIDKLNVPTKSTI